MSELLTSLERQIVITPEIMLAKNAVIQKVYELFGNLASAYQEHIGEAVQDNAKISRGENYLSLPYVMLDYPRNFSKQNTFAIRTFFWWGNFFSITLQLEGECLSRYSPSIQRAITNDELSGWYIGISSNRWEHHFEVDNYQLLHNDQQISGQPFLKLAKKIPLDKWDEAEAFFIENFLLLSKILFV